MTQQRPCGYREYHRILRLNQQEQRAMTKQHGCNNVEAAYQSKRDSRFCEAVGLRAKARVL
ncbi:hypothetical protein IT6_00340 [Methylacidiphilum caldifontis]|uniref:hypothetical protein n=1 Tax=Methylacidiphilum caldifontis TaxID=2795386 RepID=UPI001A90496B|nr:hypothetical protein [Methylacidiphilum caldifontis]QSR88797.1 hypothetical protein IT6_00340 [Methylacidiphilum caldifontis]